MLYCTFSVPGRHYTGYICKNKCPFLLWFYGRACYRILISSNLNLQVVLNVVKMASKAEYDCIVIGAGVQGSFTAYQLTKRNKKTLLLEQVCHTRNLAPWVFIQRCAETAEGTRQFRHLRLCAYVTFGSLLGSSSAIKASSVSGVAGAVSMSEVPLPCWNLRSKQASRDMSSVTCESHMWLQLFRQQLALFGIQPTPAVCSRTRLSFNQEPRLMLSGCSDTDTARPSLRAV